MTGPRRIDSPANPRVKTWRALQERRERDRTGRFIIEGAREVARAAASGIAITTFLISDFAAPDSREMATHGVPGAEHFELSRAAMERVSRRQGAPDVIAIAEQPTWSLEDLGLVAPSLVLIADSIEKPGNLGAMMRSADGAGADAVLLSDPATDPGNPNVIRASQGAVFTLPVAAAAASDVAQWAESAGLRILTTRGDATMDLWQGDYTSPVAFVIGSEAKGLSAPWRRYEAVSVPMAGRSDSLNASVAAALALYEAVRQRTAADR